MNSAIIIFSCIVFLVIQQSTTAINCYQCIAGTDGCGASTFNKAGAGVVSMSDSSAAYCTKVTYASNSNAASRSYISTGSTCTSTTGTINGLINTQSCCSTDLCNSGQNQVANVFLAMMAAIIGYFLTK